jgi:hypothetical protein
LKGVGPTGSASVRNGSGRGCGTGTEYEVAGPSRAHLRRSPRGGGVDAAKQMTCPKYELS